LIVTKYIEQSELNYLTPYVQSLPTLMTALTPYRDCKLKELLNTETLIKLINTCSQSEVVKSAFKDSEYKDAIAKMAELKPQFIESFHNISIKDFLNLAKVIAHPNFHLFIKGLPKTTTFAEMNILINSELDSVPENTREALKLLREYQTNRERIEENTNAEFKGLREEFNLTKEKLLADLARLKPKILQSSEVEEKEKKHRAVITKPTTPWLKITASAAGLALLIAYNVVFFSIMTLLASVCLVLWYSSSYIKKGVSSLFKPNDNNNQESIEIRQSNNIAPIHVRTLKPHRDIVVTNRASQNTGDVVTTTQQLSSTIFGFFKKSEKTTFEPTNKPISLNI